MNAKEIPIYQFLEGSDKSFIIPVYQRDYAWTKFNCQKLWDDLVDLKDNNRKDHFFGTLVTIGRDFQVYTVIDGQQRLTTVSILLIALHNFLKYKEKKTEEESILSEQILDFVINKYKPEKDKRIRLKSNKQDKEYFESLINDQNKKPNTESVDSNIVSNYNFFYEKIKSMILSPQEVFNTFKKLKIVLINLESKEDDPQLIFESLNSTGVDLTAGDLIRNYILMDLEPEEQETMYKKYWVEIEESTENIAEFVRNYLNFKKGIPVKKGDVYTVFKKFAKDKFHKDKEAVLKDLLGFSKIYGWLLQINNHPNSAINKQLERLNKLEFTVAHSYLFDVFNDLTNNDISEKNVVEILKIIESYAFRKFLVDNTTQGLNKIFITLSKEIKKEKSWKEEYLNILSYILLEKRGSQRFPANDEFENSLITKEIYKLQAKRSFLLNSLENYKSAYTVNVDELTIEHIMPQKLNKEWKESLGDSWPRIHKKYLHTLGNLSLTAQNTKLSNKSFKDKKEIDYQVSKLKLNYTLTDIKEWNEEKIVDRAKDLIKKAKEIWPYPKTTYTKLIQDEQKFDLTSEEDYTGKKPSRLYFEDDKQGIELKTWTDLLTNGCKHLHAFSPTQFVEIQSSQEFRNYFQDENSLKQPVKFLPNKYVEGSIEVNDIVSLLSKICERLNYPAENISFSIKDTIE